MVFCDGAFLKTLERKAVFVFYESPAVVSSSASIDRLYCYLFAQLFVATGMAVEESCVLVLIQCRDREWNGDIHGDEDWAWQAAQKCISAGFGVLRVPTRNWSDVKRDHPEWFRPVWRDNLDKQHVICTINFIHLLCPMLQEVHNVLQSCDGDNVQYCQSRGLDIYVPEGVKRLSTDLYVVCEASSNIASNLSPRSLRLIYGQYPEPLL